MDGQAELTWVTGYIPRCSLPIHLLTGVDVE